MEPKRNSKEKIILRAKSNNGDFMLPECKTHKNATSIKTVFEFFRSYGLIQTLC